MVGAQDILKCDLFRVRAVLKRNIVSDSDLTLNTLNGSHHEGQNKNQVF